MALLHSCLWEGKKSTQNQLKQREKNQKTETIIFPQEEGKKMVCVHRQCPGSDKARHSDTMMA